MEKRSLFQKIFGIKESISFGTDIQLLNGYNATFTGFDRNIYNDSLVRACVDAIARNGAKLNPKHIRKSTELNSINGNLQRLIGEKPNGYMNAYDFYYKIISQLMINNNAFIWIDRDDNGRVNNLYPINFSSVKIKETQNTDIIYVEFQFANGKRYQALYDDVIHLKRFFNNNDIFGGSNIPLNDCLELKHTIKEGIINAIKTTASLKGVLKNMASMLNPKDVAKTRDKFIEDLKKGSDNMGIAGLDSTMEFKEINLNPMTATDEQIKSNKDDILAYFGINEKVIQSTYNSDEWSAFYEGVLEPIAIMLGLEFTNKIFTKTERGFGNQIIFEANRLQYMSNKEKLEFVKVMGNYSTINEIREVFNMAPREDGDKIMQSLNYVDGGIANEYQLGGNE